MARVCARPVVILAASALLALLSASCGEGGEPTPAPPLPNFGIPTPWPTLVPTVPPPTPVPVKGDMTKARVGHTATVLIDRRVMVTGGLDETFSTSRRRGISSTEIYDSASGIWSAAGRMVEWRAAYTNTLLGDGRALVAGGWGVGYESSAEVFSPFSGTWSLTGEMATKRLRHTAVLLEDGRVLVAVGRNEFRLAVPGTEIFDPALNTWSETGDMAEARFTHGATLLQDGRELVAGGWAAMRASLSSAEIFDPDTDTWSPSGGAQ